MQDVDPSVTARSIRRHLIAGGLASLVLIVGAGGWASATNLAGAVVSTGFFVVDSYVKKVQHPTGGVVGEILVHEGQKVSAGDVLMRLDATQTKANLAIVVKRLDELMARLARLEAERDDEAEIAFPAMLLSLAGSPEVDATLASERRLFEFRQQSRMGKEKQLLERIAQYEHEIAGLKAQEAAFDRGLAVLEEEIVSQRSLHGQGIVSVQRLNTLVREAATMGGDRGEAIAAQAQVAGRISEARLQILQIGADLKTEVGNELRDVQAQLGEFVERKVAAEDQLRRIDVVAPQEGRVHQLAVHTLGGVISPGDVIMQIVPGGDRLALDVRISPQDIDQITLGQHAVLRLSAFNQRTTPELNGTVSRIAADLSHDERTGFPYYGVRITIPADELSRLSGLALAPGMPAEAYIRTGDRTALSYLVKPLSDQISRAFREE